MARIRLINPEDRKTIMGAEFLRAKVPDFDFDQGLLDGKAWPYFPAEGEGLYLWEFSIAPNEGSPVHAHSAPEIIYILSGQLSFGALVARTGSAVYVPEDTLYATQAGPDGCHILLFRGDTNVAMTMKDDFLAQRAAAKAGSSN